MAYRKSTVSVYVRENGTRKYKPASHKTIYPLGTIFCLRYKRADGRRCFETLQSANYGAAFSAAKMREMELFNEKVNGTPLPQPERPEPKPVAKVAIKGSVPLDVAIDRYLTAAAKKAGSTVVAYNYGLSQFYKSCKKATVQEVTQEDLFDFVVYLRGTGAGDRTIHNKINGVCSFLNFSGVKDVKLRHKFTKKIVRSYRPDELKALFKEALPEEWILMQFFLATGARDAEVMYAEWDAIDFTERIFHIRETADFKPKDAEEREITLPDFLVRALAKRRATATCKYIFPAKNGGVNLNFLRVVKNVARRATLPGNFGLHVFRKSYATLLHRNGTDAKTIQRLLGHSSIATTLCYLEGENARSERSRTASNQTFAQYA
jgi:integrase